MWIPSLSAWRSLVCSVLLFLGLKGWLGAMGKEDAENTACTQPQDAVCSAADLGAHSVAGGQLSLPTRMLPALTGTGDGSSCPGSPRSRFTACVISPTTPSMNPALEAVASWWNHCFCTPQGGHWLLPGAATCRPRAEIPLQTKAKAVHVLQPVSRASSWAVLSL